jgi:succinoglycan biosynthesis transport protein ExoP
MYIDLESNTSEANGGNVDEVENAPSFGDLIRAVKQRVWLIVLGVVVVMGGTTGFTLIQQPTYVASTTMVVSQDNSTPGNLGNDVEGLQKIGTTMANLVATRPVAERVVRQLDLQITPQELLDHLNAEAISGTQLIRITYEDPSAQRAEQVVNTVGDVFSKEASDVLTNANGVTTTVWDQAAVPDRPASPNLVLNLCLALVVGLAFGVGAAFLGALFDNRRSVKKGWWPSNDAANTKATQTSARQ